MKKKNSGKENNLAKTGSQKYFKEFIKI